MENYFNVLNAVNVGDKAEKKNGLTYLSWAWAWGEIKKRHPEATYTIYENKDGLFYHHDDKTAWVKTGVTVNGIEHIEYLPVMDYRNQSIPIAKITSFDVNKAIQRSLTKAVARHGLGLYIYAGEDLPEEPEARLERREKPEKTTVDDDTAKADTEKGTCERCKKHYGPVTRKDGTAWPVKDMKEYSKLKFGGDFCPDCMKILQKEEKAREIEQGMKAHG